MGRASDAQKAERLNRARHLLGVPEPPTCNEGDEAASAQDNEWNTCSCCGGRMVIIETFDRGCQPRHRPAPPIGIDSS